MRRKIYIGLVALAFIIFVGLGSSENNAGVGDLERIHQKIAIDYPSISHISRSELAALLLSGELLILDTRPMKEYDVSHIAGALQVDPNIDTDVFETKFSKILKNKTVIVYCSVGQRSSSFADRVQTAALRSGAVSVQNLEGGLFGWHNDSRNMVNASGPTSQIHPYNSYWGRLIENKDSIRYHP